MAKAPENLTVNQAAEVLGVSARQVRNLIAGERIKAEKLGRDYIIRRVDLAAAKNRKPGRPRKAK